MSFLDFKPYSFAQDPWWDFRPGPATLRPLLPTVPVAPVLGQGWKCPVCGIGVAPAEAACPRCMGRQDDIGINIPVEIK